MPKVNYFDPAFLAVPDDAAPTTPAAGKKRDAGRCKSAPFLKGPVPWSWLRQAMQLGGKVIAVGLMLWKESGCEGTRTFKFCVSRSTGKGLSRWTIYRGLQRLERAGLITSRCRPGRGLEITLLVEEEA
jgi:hypothetical protein